MSDEKTMTAEQAWAEVDRLDRESDAALAAAEKERDKADVLVVAYYRAKSKAEAIGPRPAKVHS